MCCRRSRSPRLSSSPAARRCPPGSALRSKVESTAAGPAGNHGARQKRQLAGGAKGAIQPVRISPARRRLPTASRCACGSPEKAERTLDVQYFRPATGRHGAALPLGALLWRPARHAACAMQVTLLGDALGVDGGAGDPAALRCTRALVTRVFNPLRRTAAVDPPARRRMTCSQVGSLRLPDAQQALRRRQQHRVMTGGRNIGDRYFPGEHLALEFGDFDICGRRPDGPAAITDVRSLLERPARDPGGERSRSKQAVRRRPSTPAARPSRCTRRKMGSSAYPGSLARGDPLRDIVTGSSRWSGRRPRSPTTAPTRHATVNGDQPGRLLWKRVSRRRRRSAKSDLIIVSPYLVPGPPEMELLRQLRARGDAGALSSRRNSLSNLDRQPPIVHTGYSRYRVPAAADGRWSSTRCAGIQVSPRRIAVSSSPSSGAFSCCHAKVFVIDRGRVVR